MEERPGQIPGGRKGRMEPTERLLVSGGLKVGDRVRHASVEEPGAAVGKVVRLFSGMAKGMVSVEWPGAHGRPVRALHAAADLDVVE